MSGIKLAGVLLAYVIEDVPDGCFQGLKGGEDFRPEPFVVNFVLEDFDFVEVGAVCGQVQ